MQDQQDGLAGDGDRRLAEPAGDVLRVLTVVEAIARGQQQRAAIARALAIQPEVMLFDEPTSALDPELVGEVLSVIGDLAREGRTMILVTHEMKFAREVANQIVFLKDGIIEEQGEPEAIFNAPKSADLKRFISSVS